VADYIGQAERLRDWTVLDIQNHPALTVGMLRSAGASIEKLVSEVDRLNLENFWLSKNQKSTGNRIVELPPVNNGDNVWFIGRFNGNICIKRGRVGRIEIMEGKAVVYVKGIGTGEYGTKVFDSFEDAEAYVTKEGKV
jgi:hypothetical protein